MAEHHENPAPEEPENTGPGTNGPEGLPPEGLPPATTVTLLDVSLATLNAATDAFINGMSEASRQEQGEVKRSFQMMTVMGKLVTSNTRLLSHQLTQLERSWTTSVPGCRKIVNLVRAALKRTTMANFAKQFEGLSDTTKAMTGSSKSVAYEEHEVKKKLLKEFEAIREVMNHVRSGNIAWQVQELRTGTSNGQGGSLLSTLEVGLDNLDAAVRGRTRKTISRNPISY